MSKLEEYYQFIDNLQQEGKLSEEQMVLYSRIEEELILDEVCQHVGELVKDELSKIRRATTFVIVYDPTGKIKVTAAHNRHTETFFEPKAINSSTEEAVVHKVAEEQEPAEQTHAIEETPNVTSEPVPENTESGITRGPRKNFRVFLYGKEVKAKDGAGLLAETIRRIGFKKVAALNIKYVDGEFNLVDRRQRVHKGQVWQRKIGDWYIYTNSTTPEKIKRLREIAERLHIDLVVLDDNSTFETEGVREFDSNSNKDYILITSSNINDSENRDLRISYNGKVFEGNNAKNVFIDTLKDIGLSRIPAVGIICSGYNLVSTTQRTDGRNKWQEFHDGYWIYTYFNNPSKVRYLRKIAEYYQLNIKIEAINKK